MLSIKRQHLFLAAIAATLIAGSVLTGYFVFSDQPQVLPLVKAGELAASTPNCERRRWLDGICLAAGEESPLAVAMMIENHIDARPQSGLADANFVIEAPVEGGVSRLLVVYLLDKDLPLIGPVRSARPYYLDWVKELGALYGHVGGSEEALQKINAYQIFDLNQYWQDKYFWREQSKSSPHNVYTSTAKLRAALADLNASRSDAEAAVESWRFKDETSINERPSDYQVLSIKFSPQFVKEYTVDWFYQSADNSYRCQQADGSLNDDAGQPLLAKNLVAQFTAIEVMDDAGRRKIKTIGAGRALIFQDGQRIVGSWKKTSRESRTRFYDSRGQEISFNAGLTWINVVPDDGQTVVETLVF